MNFADITVQTEHVELRKLGTGEDAICERATGEPLQYCRDAASAPGLLQRWEAVLGGFIARARR